MNEWKNKNFFEALKNALNGLKYTIKTQKDLKIQIFIAIIVAFVVVDLVLCYFAFFRKDKIETKTFKNNYLEFTYTDDYSIKERETKISIGKDDKSGQIDIVITELSDDVLKRDNDFIIQEANEEFENNNKNYFVNYYGSYKVKDYVVKDFLYTNENAGKQIDFNYKIWFNFSQNVSVRRVCVGTRAQPWKNRDVVYC